MSDNLEILTDVVKTQLMNRMETVDEFHRRIARGDGVDDGEIRQLLLESVLIDAHALAGLVDIVNELDDRVTELRRRLDE